MALKTFRTDDLTNEPDAVPVVITVNGRGIEIDLAPRSVDKLTKLLAPYWAAASESTYDVERRNRARNGASRGYDLAELRAWADREGIALPQRGRIPAAVVQQYLRS